MPEKRGVGQPLKFKNPEELQEAIDDYFFEREIDGLPITISGMCLALDCTLQTLLNYQARDEYFDIVKRAKLKVMDSFETRLAFSDRPTREIFPLKAMGMPDRQQLDHVSSDGSMSPSSMDDFYADTAETDA